RRSRPRRPSPPSSRRCRSTRRARSPTLGRVALDVLRFEGLLEGEELAHVATEPERDARVAPLPEGLDERVAAAGGAAALCAQPPAVWDAASRGEHVLVTTGTASGKTLAFNLPILDAVDRTPKTRVLYLYPTKALAQDQFRTLAGYGLPGLKPAIYDGDTPIEHRRRIRLSANAILTNPDL